MDLETLDDILEALERHDADEEHGREYFGEPRIRHALRVMATRLKELQAIVAEQKLLIEHEENVRTTKRRSQPRSKSLARLFKVNDVVVTPQGEKATIERLGNGRAKIVFAISDSDGFQRSRWFDTKSLKHSVVK